MVPGAIQAPVLDRFGYMVNLDVDTGIQIGNSPGNF